jgi:hypothetical protein
MNIFDVIAPPVQDLPNMLMIYAICIASGLLVAGIIIAIFLLVKNSKKKKENNKK